MKRWVLAILLFLLLGAVANVAVAWGCVLLANHVWSSEAMADPNPEHATPSAWRRSVPGSWPKAPISERTHERKWFRVVQQSWHSEDPLWREAYKREGILDYYVLSEWRIGVPAKALSYDSHVHLAREGGPLSTTRLLEHAIPAPPGKQRLAFPAHPIWPGFAVNTLLYGTLFCVLTCLAIAVRRFLRLRRGLCPQCAYPMGESAVCSECGKARA